ncbi:hypothetical protein EXIGLDRAFT_759252 [Exidia glandulosa HHB12029]|uniref:Elongator complex protein 5 n=1 Tax=Exidia glandulosa HHB12029 TaxID=1314781 RepID=A0A166BRA7_EXIGL|nr:hypothetical protein EXIGLDRAFT_759252 [Exidia glandulosa HHB12029]
MTLLLPDILAGKDASKCPLVVVQHDLAQSPFPILRQILAAASHVVLVRTLHPIDTFVDATSATAVTDIDWTGIYEHVGEQAPDRRQQLFDAIAAVPSEPSSSSSAGPRSLVVLIDSLDTVSEDLGSVAQAARLVRDVLSALASIPRARLILPILTPSPTLASLSAIHPRTELRLHAPALLRHLARELMTPPEAPRFWTLLSELVARREGEKLARGAPNVHGPTVVEVVVPSRRGVLRVVEVWDDGQVTDVATLGLNAPAKLQEPNDAMSGLSFNLSLTSEQQEARSRVALPYAHTGQPKPSGAGAGAGEIIYDPDSADDFDEEDPDDDLEL